MIRGRLSSRFDSATGSVTFSSGVLGIGGGQDQEDQHHQQHIDEQDQVDLRLIGARGRKFIAIVRCLRAGVQRGRAAAGGAAAARRPAPSAAHGRRPGSGSDARSPAPESPRSGGRRCCKSATEMPCASCSGLLPVVGDCAPKISIMCHHRAEQVQQRRGRGDGAQQAPGGARPGSEGIAQSLPPGASVAGANGGQHQPSTELYARFVDHVRRRQAAAGKRVITFVEQRRRASDARRLIEAFDDDRQRGDGAQDQRPDRPASGLWRSKTKVFPQGNARTLCRHGAAAGIMASTLG